MENTRIKNGKETIEATDLYTMAEYSRKFGSTVSKVKYHVMAGNLKSLRVNGTTLVVREDGK